MTIRPVDLQTMIPKLPELQKARSLESELEKNNLNINIHKDQQQNEKNTKQVIQTKKPSGGKVERDKQDKQKQGRQESGKKDQGSEKKEEQEKQEKGRILTRIDIRI
jgi:hypothetical protein